ncbi:MAG: rod shape-determining protein RodA [Patescibacteria group bacterium]
MFNLSKFSPRSFDWTLFSAVVLLVALGLSAIYSVDLSRGAELVYFKKQLIALGAGLALFFWASQRQYTFWRSSAKWWYVLALVLLLGVLIFGQNIRGTKGWFTLGGFNFQPVEFAKVGIILIMAYIISRFGRRYERPLFFWGTGAVALTMIGLVMLQPDLGSAVLIGLIWLGLVYLVGTRRLFLLSLILGLIAAAALGWSFFLKDYQKNRLLNFIDPARDPLISGYNLNQSLIAVGSGQFFGRGLGFGSQSQLRFLPEAQTDFIFAVISEELGFVGSSVIMILFGVIFWRFLRLIKNSGDDFISAVVAGILILFFSQVVINVGAGLGLLPITGVTLPFVSYGGSSLLINLFLIGIAESMVVKKY